MVQVHVAPPPVAGQGLDPWPVSSRAAIWPYVQPLGPEGVAGSLPVRSRAPLRGTAVALPAPRSALGAARAGAPPSPLVATGQAGSTVTQSCDCLRRHPLS